MDGSGRSVARRIAVALVGMIGFGAAALMGQSSPAPPAQGGGRAIDGRVVNGTTGKPVANAKVNFVMMMRGPAPLASETTDAEGRFHFKNAPDAAGAPALLRVEYQGTVYSLPLLPQQPLTGEAQIQVFEAAHDPKMVSVKEHAIFLHPSANVLLVLEQIVLGNETSPSKTYVNEKGTLPFSLPGKARDAVKVTVEGPGGMPISQPAVPRNGENSFAITYPMRPGETQVRLEYALDYHSPFVFSKRLDMPAEQVHLVTPGKNVQLTGDGLTPMGADPQTGFTGFRVMPQGNLVKVEIAGEVPAEQVAVPGAGGEGGEESGALAPISDPISARRWYFVAGMALVMLAGFVYHYRYR